MSHKQKEQEHPVLLSKRNVQLAQLGARVLAAIEQISAQTDYHPDPKRLWRAELIGERAVAAARDLGLFGTEEAK